jgi:hypothetical protein
MSTSTLTEPINDLGGEALIDLQFELDHSKPVLKNGKLYINPFGVLMGKNLSGEDRAVEAIKDKAFMATIRRFGVIQPVIVKRVDYEGKKVYGVVAGNRRTFGLRHSISQGEIPLDDERALLPLYEMNDISLDNVSSEDAANLLENAMRKGMDHISKAHAIQRLITGGASHEELSLLVTGQNRKPLSKEAVRQYLCLLKLHPTVQAAVREGVMVPSMASRIADLSYEEQLSTLAKIRDRRNQCGKASKENRR